MLRMASKKGLAGLRPARRFLSAAAVGHKVEPSTDFDLKSNVLEFADQTVFAGTESLNDMFSALKDLGYSKPLLVTDAGIHKLGMLGDIQGQMEQGFGFSTAVFAECVPNPGVADIAGIAQAFLENDCDVCVGVGGGGPLDAAKGGMALVAKKRIDQTFDLKGSTGDFVSNECRGFASYAGNTKGFVEAIPPVCAVPTTSGTGSDGGKSAVICDPSGVKVVFGHPALMPKLAALDPNLTVKLPPHLTAGTGIDAFFHSFEAYMVPTDIMTTRDGMTMAEIEYCDGFALKGMELVCRSLDRAVEDGADMESRLRMQIAALYGAKAFRKGDLGGVHASAHALGAVFHRHHGECIARMAVPVIEHSESRQDFDGEAKERAGALAELISTFSPTSSASPSHGTSLSQNVRHIDGKGGRSKARRDSPFSGLDSFSHTILNPIKDLVPEGAEGKDVEVLAELAANDGCQTNPVPLDKTDYHQIFARAASM